MRATSGGSFSSERIDAVKLHFIIDTGRQQPRAQPLVFLHERAYYDAHDCETEYNFRPSWQRHVCRGMLKPWRGFVRRSLRGKMEPMLSSVSQIFAPSIQQPERGRAAQPVAGLGMLILLASALMHAWRARARAVGAPVT